MDGIDSTPADRQIHRDHRSSRAHQRPGHDSCEKHRRPSRRDVSQRACHTACQGRGGDGKPHRPPTASQDACPRKGRRSRYPLRMLAVVSPRHPLASRRTLTIDDLAREPLLMLGERISGAAGLRCLMPSAERRHRGEPVSAIDRALDGADHGIAIVPSVVVLERKRVAIVGLVQMDAARVLDPSRRGSAAVLAAVRGAFRRDAGALHETVVPGTHAGCDSGCEAASGRRSPASRAAILDRYIVRVMGTAAATGHAVGVAAAGLRSLPCCVARATLRLRPRPAAKGGGHDVPPVPAGGSSRGAVL